MLLNVAAWMERCYASMSSEYLRSGIIVRAYRPVVFICHSLRYHGGFIYKEVNDDVPTMNHGNVIFYSEIDNIKIGRERH